MRGPVRAGTVAAAPLSDAIVLPQRAIQDCQGKYLRPGSVSSEMQAHSATLQFGARSAASGSTAGAQGGDVVVFDGCSASSPRLGR